MNQTKTNKCITDLFETIIDFHLKLVKYSEHYDIGFDPIEWNMDQFNQKMLDFDQLPPYYYDEYVNDLTYDASFRLMVRVTTVQEDVPASTPIPTPSIETEEYQYLGNNVGNRCLSHLSSTYSYNALNQLTSDETHSYTYDNNGNITSNTWGSNLLIFTYNQENQLSQITVNAKGTSKTITFKYNSFGRRIERNDNGDIRRFVYDLEDIFYEFDGSNTLICYYLHCPSINEPILQTIGANPTSLDEVFPCFQNWRGDVEAVTDGNSNVVQTYRYDRFGRILETESSHTLNPNFANRYLFTDWKIEHLYKEAGTHRPVGIYYFRARYYDPEIGHFIQEDPIGFAWGDTNFYSYVWNNPINYNNSYGFQSTFNNHYNPWSKYRGVLLLSYLANLSGYINSLRYGKPAFSLGNINVYINSSISEPYTIGNYIFHPCKYNKRDIAHELIHVAQQNSWGVLPILYGHYYNIRYPNPYLHNSLEIEAEIWWNKKMVYELFFNIEFYP